MKCSLTIWFVLLCALCTNAQNTSAGLQQYYYHSANADAAVFTPVAHYRSSTNWYGEARYNYDELNTFSMYGGRTFKRDAGVSWEATPIIGGLVGKMNGGSVGLNMDVEYRKIFFSSQAQYTMSFEEQSNRYFFNWSELGIQPLDWLYGGLALQQTNVYRTRGEWDRGYVLGFNFGNWTMPVYAFNPSGKNRFFVLGLVFSWEQKTKSTNIIVADINNPSSNSSTRQ